jgi:hypothetical protein
MAIDLEMQLKGWPGPTKAGRRLNVCGARVRNLVREGRLAAIRTELGLLINPESLERLVREREKMAAPAAATTD